ncbi:MAG: hypothetical protein ACJ8F7_21395 [Gemmataceae bacterium]
MSIRARIEDAFIAFSLGRPEAALLSVLTAISATSRRRRPRGTPSVTDPSREMGDREAFELFSHEQMPIICRVQNYNLRFRGEMHRLEHILYRWIRCELAHEAGLPSDVHFVADERPGVVMIALDETGLRISHGFLDGLADAVIQAPENTDHFGAPPRPPLPIHIPRMNLTILAAEEVHLPASAAEAT